MANKYLKTIVCCWIFMLVATLDTISHGRVAGLQKMDRSNFSPEPKGTIKTIEVPEDGDLIDCVDIYKQPAFDDPLMKEIKMKPSPDVIRAFNKLKGPPRPEIIQNWHKYGKCPEGTVPIRRPWKKNDIFHRIPRNDDPSEHEHAIAFVPKGIYHGASAAFNLWNPKVQGRSEFSLSQMWLISRPDTPRENTIEAGWIVYPGSRRFRDSKTRLFAFWTNDGYNRTRCYNYDCRGFVQVNYTYTLGSVMGPISVYGRNQYATFIAIIKDRRSGDWWLQIQETVIGYFRRQIFTTMGFGAENIEFGGEIVNERIRRSHTSTQMGSGHFSREGFGRASFIKNIVVMNRFGIPSDALLSPFVSNPGCYDLAFGLPNTSYKSHFFFGGPGYSYYCR